MYIRSRSIREKSQNTRTQRREHTEFIKMKLMLAFFCFTAALIGKCSNIITIAFNVAFAKIIL